MKSIPFHCSTPTDYFRYFSLSYSIFLKFSTATYPLPPRYPPTPPPILPIPPSNYLCPYLPYPLSTPPSCRSISVFPSSSPSTPSSHLKQLLGISFVSTVYYVPLQPVPPAPSRCIWPTVLPPAHKTSRCGYARLPARRPSLSGLAASSTKRNCPSPTSYS